MTVDDAREQGSAGAALRPSFSALLVSALVGPSPVLELRGELDLESVPELRAALDPLVRSGSPVTLDLAGVTFMDSAGVHVLVGAASAVGECGRVVVLHASPMVRRVLELSGVVGFFEHQ